jgi:hypothetical protein
MIDSSSQIDRQPRAHEADDRANGVIWPTEGHGKPPLMAPDPMLPRSVTEMPAPEYHARPEWSQSQLKLLPNHPELFHGFHIAKKWTFGQTPDMWLGECVHGVALEGRELLTPPPEALTSNGQRRGKAWEQWSAEHAGDLVLLEKDAAKVHTMAASLRDDPKIRQLLDADGDVELSLFWTDPETELPLRARLDKLARFGSGLVIGDLKCTNIDPADERQVAAKVLNFKYHQQAAFYLDAMREATGTEPAGFLFIFVRNSPPYNAVLWRIEDVGIDLARRRNRVALIDLKERLARNFWRGSRYGIENPLQLPKWAYTDDPGDNTPTDFAEFAEFDQFDGNTITLERLT